MIKNKTLLEQGHVITKLPLANFDKCWITEQNYQAIDSYFTNQLKLNTELTNYLLTFGDFTQTEFIISLRDANDPDQEDGIWHDDGSREFAFSLSLTQNPEEVRGGVLQIRNQDTQQIHEIKTPPFGEAIIFLTGKYHFDHRILKVERNQRLIIAGWLN